MSPRRVVTREEFEALPPFRRGWAVYMAGERDDQPNIPNEANPYPTGSVDADEWNRGQQVAMVQVLDSEE